MGADRLLERQDAIQGKLAKKHLTDGVLVLDGCYVIFTDVPQEDMPAVEAVKNYKSLMRAEQAFRNMKTVQLEVRSVYHKTDDRMV